MHLYVICDQVAQESGPVFEAKNNSVALRNYKQFIEKSKVNPSEFTLLYIGSIDHELVRRIDGKLEHKFMCSTEPTIVLTEVEDEPTSKSK